MTILEPVAVQPPQELAHKTYSALMTKLIDEEQGIVEALVSVTGNLDSSNDIIEPGAYAKSLENRKPKVCYGHDWGQPIGKCLEIYEIMPGDPRLPEDLKSAGFGALYAKILVARNTRRGADAWEEMKFFHDESQWSIGYAVKDAEYSKDANANLLKDLDLFELSWVLWGANGATRSLALKVNLASEKDEKDQIVIAGDLDDSTKDLILKAVEGVLVLEKGNYSAAERREMAKSGEALPDGSFPIKNCADVEDAKHRIGTTNHAKATVVAHINKRADALGCPKVGETSDDGKSEEIPAAPSVLDEIKALLDKQTPCECKTEKTEETEEVEVKAGRVLSGAHANHLKQAKDHIDHVLNAAAPKDPDDSKKELEPAEAEAEIAADALKQAQEDLAKAQERLSSLTEETLKDSHPSETSDDTWDGSPQWKRLPADVTSLKLATAWVDAEKDPEKKSSYKFIHHFVDEKGEIGAASTAACLIGIGALNSKGSVVPDEDKVSVYDHLKSHLEAAGNPDVPELKSDPDDQGAGKPPGFSADRFDPNAGENPAYNEVGEPPSYTEPEITEPQVDGAEPHNFVADPDDPEACAICGQPATAPIHDINVDAHQKDVYSAGPGQQPGGRMQEDGEVNKPEDQKKPDDGKDKPKPHKFVPGGKKPVDDNDENDMKKSDDMDDMGAGDTCKVCGQPEEHAIHTADPYGKGEGFTHQLKRIKHFLAWYKSNMADDLTISGPEETADIKQVLVSGPDDNPAMMIQAIDAAIDEAMDELDDGDIDQASALVAAADVVVDALLEALGIPDADDSDEDAGETENSVVLSPKELLELEIQLADIELG